MNSGAPITSEKVWKEYTAMLAYNQSINLDKTVQRNEDFFIGRQWEGVESNGLPTPIFNFLKRVTLFTVASNTTDNLKIHASPLGAYAARDELSRATDVINHEFESIFEFNKIGCLIREYMRNAAVDGDAATYTYWDPTVDSGRETKGSIVTEVIENTRVGFGNPADRRVQKQPYILIKRREMTEQLKRRAKKYGCRELDSITPDEDEQIQSGYKDSVDFGYTTVILRLWKDEETGEVMACETTRNAIIRKQWGLGLRLYPITWLNWDYIQNSYHGQAMITGLLPNQEFVNKLFAMSMIALMASAFPKTIFDKTRIQQWNNSVGSAIGVNGGDVNTVAKILAPAAISPQISQFIELAVNLTQSFLGATSVALGETRPDNTSAIIALQRAASTPNEITKQNLYQSIEDLGRIYIDFMGEYYGLRETDIKLPDDGSIDAGAIEFAGMKPGDMITVSFDFASLKTMPMTIKLDVGASAYWSEIATTQTLDNLLMNKQIGIIEYLERIPDGYISGRRELIDTIKARQAAVTMELPPGEGTGTSKAETPLEALPVRGGSGNGELQRKLSAML